MITSALGKSASHHPDAAILHHRRTGRWQSCDTLRIAGVLLGISLATGSVEAQRLDYTRSQWAKLLAGEAVQTREYREGDFHGETKVAILVKAQLENVWDAVLDLEGREQFLNKYYKFVRVLPPCQNSDLTPEKLERQNSVTCDAFWVCKFGPSFYQVVIRTTFDWKARTAKFAMNENYKESQLRTLRERLHYGSGAGLPKVEDLKVPKKVWGGYVFHPADKAMPKDLEIPGHAKKDFVLVEYSATVRDRGLGGTMVRLGEGIGLNGRFVADNLLIARTWVYDRMHAAEKDRWPGK